MDLRALRDGDAIVAAVKAEAARDLGQRLTQWARIDGPQYLVQDTGMVGAGNSLDLPVNAELERLAKMWLKSSAQFLRMPAESKPAPTASSASSPSAAPRGTCSTAGT
jgi:hypothetical protein